MLQIYILWDEKALCTSSRVDQWSGISCNCALRCERVWSTSFPSDAEEWPSWLSTIWKAWDSVSDWNAADSTCDLIANLKKESMTYFVSSRGHTALKGNHHYWSLTEKCKKIQNTVETSYFLCVAVRVGVFITNIHVCAMVAMHCSSK